MIFQYSVLEQEEYHKESTSPQFAISPWRGESDQWWPPTMAQCPQFVISPLG